MIAILAIFGIAFAIKEIDGPFGILSLARNKLILNKYFGVFFYKLLSCYFCLGCYCGLIVYMLYEPSYRWQSAILWFFAGGIICLLGSKMLEKLSNLI